jgi:hypothetical protein
MEKTVRVIVADKIENCDHLLGTFLDNSHYDILIDEDCDLYAPADCDLSSQANHDKDYDEKRVLFKFRKRFFTKEEQQMALDGLKEAATESQNRGLAAGPRGDKLQNRDWVTAEQFEILEYLIDPRASLDGSDPIDEIRTRHARGVVNVEQRGMVWLTSKVKDTKFDFNEWVEGVRNLPLNEVSAKAKEVAKSYISETSYANPVNSGIAGWYDRYPRIPYGRATSYTRDNFEKFKKSFPMLQKLSKGFSDYLPQRWSAQKECIDKLDPAFYVPETVFTTITVNRTFRTAAHRDAGDLSAGFSNLVAMDNGKKYSGAYLVLPEVRVAVNIRPGDLLLINNHEVIHGNTPIVVEEEGAERYSLVCYFRENMLQLGSKAYEDCRYNFVESRRLNKEHSLWKPLWNGVSPAMWESQEWFEYLDTNLGTETLIKYHPESQSNSLENFFA